MTLAMMDDDDDDTTNYHPPMDTIYPYYTHTQKNMHTHSLVLVTLIMVVALLFEAKLI